MRFFTDGMAASHLQVQASHLCSIYRQSRQRVRQSRKGRRRRLRWPAQPGPPITPTWALLLLAHRSKKNGSLLVSLLQVMVPVVPS